MQSNYTLNNKEYFDKTISRIHEEYDRCDFILNWYLETIGEYPDLDKIKLDLTNFKNHIFKDKSFIKNLQVAKRILNEFGINQYIEIHKKESGFT